MAKKMIKEKMTRDNMAYVYAGSIPINCNDCFYVEKEKKIEPFYFPESALEEYCTTADVQDLKNKLNEVIEVVNKLNKPKIIIS